ncbi:S-adenosyl-L-methionine-dependent methyltransferase [Apiospora hydei]|uniref:S-adenosyl-L-methionine-dependent methyltransferase n=1 Tax=Apiospora hydei TaxID=1337664 RepID=A0ABR1VJ79_9PEZI
MAENARSTVLPKEGSKIRIVELAQSIIDGVAQLETVFSDKGLPFPSFEEDAPHNFPLEAFDARDVVLDASAELYDLLLDPVTLMLKRGSYNNMVSLHAISRFKIAEKVPTDGGQISFADIAKQTGVSERMIQRLLRQAITMRVFREPQEGFVAHTQASKALTNQDTAGWLASGTEDMWPAATKMVDAIEKWGNSQEPNHTGFSLAHNTEGSIYDLAAADPSRAARFAGSMNTLSKSEDYDLNYVLDFYDWTSLGAARVVDIGGSAGHVSIALARRFPDLTFVVQDMERVVSNAGANLPDDLKSRVSFMAHDLFQPQTVEADVYYMRWIFHNWSDKYCKLILEALVPALKKGSRILIQDFCMPKPGEVALWKEQAAREMDLNMAAKFNAIERTADDWKALLQAADPRFVLDDITQPKGSALSLIEALLTSNLFPPDELSPFPPTMVIFRICVRFINAATLKFDETSESEVRSLQNGYLILSYRWSWGSEEVTSIANVVSATTMALANIANTPDLVAGIKTDVHTSFGDKPLSEVDLQTLRLHAKSFTTVCSPVQDTPLGRYRLPKDDMGLIDAHVLYMDEDFWNTKRGVHPVYSFWPQRFLLDPKDPHSGPPRVSWRLAKPEDGQDSGPHFSLQGLEAA